MYVHISDDIGMYLRACKEAGIRNSGAAANDQRHFRFVGMNSEIMAKVAAENSAARERDQTMK